MGSIPSKRLLLVAVLGGAIAVGSCTDRILVDPSPDPTVLAVQPSLVPEAIEGDGVATALSRTDNVWIEVRAGDEVVFDDVLPFDPDAEQLSVQVDIPQAFVSEILTVTLELRYGDVVLFRGQATAQVQTGAAAQIEIPVEDVPASLELAPAERPLLYIGDALPLYATVLFATGDTVPAPDLAWEVIEGGVSIDQDGVVTAVDDGDALVEVRYRELADTTAVVVAREVVGVMIVDWPVGGLEPGESALLEAEARDAADHPIPDAEIVWESDDPTVATVDADGLLHAVDPGEVAISAHVEEWSDTVLVVVGPRTVDSITIDPPELELVGLWSTAQLVATAHSQDGMALPDVEFTWSSDDPSVATVDANGVVTARAEGGTTVRAEADDVVGTAAVTVIASTEPGGGILAVNGVPVEEGGPAQAQDSLHLDLRLIAGEREITGFHVEWEEPEGGRSFIGLAEGTLPPGQVLELPHLTAAAPGGAYRIFLVVTQDDGSRVDVDSIQVEVDQSDTTPPVIEWIEPADAVVSQDSVDVRFLATDNRGISRHRIYLNGALHVTTYLAASAPEYEAERRIGPLQPGENTIQVTVADVALLEASGSITVYRDDGSAFEAVRVCPDGSTVEGMPTYPTVAEGLERLASGGTLELCDGEHAIADVGISAPGLVTAEAGAQPVLVHGDGEIGFIVDGFTEGVLTFRDLTFRNENTTGGAYYSLRIGGDPADPEADAVYDRVEVDDVTFDLVHPDQGRGVIVRGSTVGGSMVVVSNARFEGGAFQVNAVQESRLTITGSSFDDCGSPGCVIAQTGSQVAVTESDFRIPDPEAPRALRGVGFLNASGRVETSTFDGCGADQCVIAWGNASVEVLQNQFASAVGSIDLGDRITYPVVIRYEGDGNAAPTGRAEGNTIDGCGGWGCIHVSHGAVAEVIDNVMTVHPARETQFGIEVTTGPGGAGSGGQAYIRGNTIRGTSEDWAANPSDPELYHMEAGIRFLDSTALLLEDNELENARIGIAFHGAESTAAEPGADNRIRGVHAAVEVLGGAEASLVRNDVTEYWEPFRVDPSPAPNLRCNWWGSDTGPENVPDGTDPEVYTPYSTAPIAGGASECDPDGGTDEPTDGEPTVSVGRGYACQLDETGRAYCWGLNSAGRLGHGGTIGSSAPVEVAGGHRFARLSASESHTCGIDETGAAWCWGANSRGELGTGSTTGSESPVAVSGSIEFSDIAVGLQFSCALDGTGEVWCWGRNEHGQLGVGDTEDRLTPTRLQSEQTFGALGVGLSHACGMTTSGESLCWGWNAFGQIGDGTTTNRPAPVPVEGGSVFATISPGGVHSCALGGDGAAYCWGGGFDMPLGDGTTQQRTTPVAVVGGHLFEGITAHRANNIHGHTCAWTGGGELYCWGFHQYGQLGTGDTGEVCGTDELACSTSPVPAGNPGATVRAGAGMGATCALTGTDTTYCWGLNASGQLGRGTVTVSGAPGTLVAPSGVPTVADLTITPATLEFTAIGETLYVEAGAVDANGYALPGVGLEIGDAEIVQRGPGFVGAEPIPITSQSEGTTWIDAVLQGGSARTDVVVSGAGDASVDGDGP